MLDGDKLSACPLVSRQPVPSLLGHHGPLGSLSGVAHPDDVTPSNVQAGTQLQGVSPTGRAGGVGGGFGAQSPPSHWQSSVMQPYSASHKPSPIQFGSQPQEGGNGGAAAQSPPCDRGQCRGTSQHARVGPRFNSASSRRSHRRRRCSRGHCCSASPTRRKSHRPATMQGNRTPRAAGVGTAAAWAVRAAATRNCASRANGQLTGTQCLFEAAHSPPSKLHTASAQL